MSGEIRVIPLARRGRELERFLSVGDWIYRDDPLHVAPLRIDMRDQFSDQNPFFEHAEMQLWVAERDGRDVGRIAGIVDRIHNEVHREAAAAFGYWESVDDLVVNGQLFGTLEVWGRQRGCTQLIGPLNPSTNNECGLLVEGFDTPAVFMMTYNPAYYARLVEAAGFTKAKDLLAFQFEINERPKARLERVAGMFARRQPDMRVRPVTKRSLAADLPKVKEIYNSAWERNWGFVPMTDREVDFLAKRLRPLLMEGLVLLAERGDEPVAFMLGLPDLNEIIRGLRGRVLTPRVLGVLPYVMGWQRPAVLRLIALGIKRSFRGRGVEAAMFAEGLKCALKAGFKTCEASWTLEDNTGVHRLIEIFGGRPYKTYRLYTRGI